MKNIEELKRSIAHKDSELYNIRAAKSDFAYQFSQSILKMINTLNMEVVDLKKKDLADDFRFSNQVSNGMNLDLLQKAYLQGNFFVFVKKRAGANTEVRRP